MISQSDILLEYLQRGHSITPALANELTGSFACHSRMAELRSRGHDIVCTIKRNGRSKWGEYRLAEKA